MSWLQVPGTMRVEKRTSRGRGRRRTLGTSGAETDATAGRYMEQRSQHVRYMTRSAILLALAMSVQMLGLPQLITGSAVNAVLYMTALTAPPAYGVAVGALTPMVALWRGILAPAAAPLVPFIAVGNAILVLVFWLVLRLVAARVAPEAKGSKNDIGVIAGGLASACRTRPWVWAALSVGGVLIASGLKAGFLAFAVARLVHVPQKIAVAMQWPQLFTALAGGVVVLTVWRALGSAGRSRAHSD